MRAGFKLPKAELEELPLTIEITMTVAEWRQLKLSDDWPGPHVASAIDGAIDRLMGLAGSRWEIDRPYGPAERVEEKPALEISIGPPVGPTSSAKSPSGAMSSSTSTATALSSAPCIPWTP